MFRAHPTFCCACLEGQSWHAEVVRSPVQVALAFAQAHECGSALPLPIGVVVLLQIGVAPLLLLAIVGLFWPALAILGVSPPLLPPRRNPNGAVELPSPPKRL